jgi:hypothetical protein
VERRIELDWLRGLMLVLMTVTHLPTWFSAHWGQPFGYVSAAEGFVFVSAFLVGCVYGRVVRTKGVAAMRRRVWRRTCVIYLAHAATLLFLLFVVLPFAFARNAHPVTDLASYYLANPHEALAGGLALAYDPPLLDILPMYVVFMAVSPFVLATASRCGFAAIAGPSVALWLLAQLDAGPALHGVLATAGFAVPYRETGAFSWLAWQLMWVLGMWAGAAAEAGRAVQPSRPMIVVAAVIALAGLLLRHALGQVPPGPPWLVAAFDKWHLGTLRMLDFGALVVLAAAATASIRALAVRSPLTLLGRAALTVFCAHLAICLWALALAPDVAPAQLGWQDTILLAGTLTALMLVARARLALGPWVTRWVTRWVGALRPPERRYPVGLAAIGASTRGRPPG